MNDDDLFKRLGMDDRPSMPKKLVYNEATNPSNGWEAPDTGEVSDTALELDEWDRKRGQDLTRKAGFPELPAEALADFHAAAFTSDPKLTPHCMDSRRQEYMKDLLESPEYKSLHTGTMYNLPASELAAKQFAQAFAKLAEEDKQRRQGKDAKKNAVRARMALTNAVGEALAGAGKDVEDLEDTLKAMGCGPGQPEAGKLDAEEVAKLFKRVRDRHMLRRIMELAGRYRIAAQAKQRQKVIHGQDDVVGVELGGDVGKLVPTELALLGDENFEWDAARRLLERQSMQRETRGVEQLGKGPVIVCVDESGSMDGAPICNAKAFALSMAWVARHQKRWIALVGYSGGRTGTLCAMPPGKWDQNALLEWLEHNYGGGTVLDVPLQELPKVYWPQLIAKGMPKGKTDLIVVTDGIVDLPQQMELEFKLWKQAEKVRCITLVIGCPPGPLERVSDEVFRMECVGLNEQGVDKCLSI